jgi:hypothetical protein
MCTTHIHIFRKFVAVITCMKLFMENSNIRVFINFRKKKLHMVQGVQMCTELPLLYMESWKTWNFIIFVSRPGQSLEF